MITDEEGNVVPQVGDIVMNPNGDELTISGEIDELGDGMWEAMLGPVYRIGWFYWEGTTQYWELSEYPNTNV